MKIHEKKYAIRRSSSQAIIERCNDEWPLGHLINPHETVVSLSQKCSQWKKNEVSPCLPQKMSKAHTWNTWVCLKFNPKSCSRHGWLQDLSYWNNADFGIPSFWHRICPERFHGRFSRLQHQKSTVWRVSNSSRRWQINFEEVVLNDTLHLYI